MNSVFSLFFFYAFSNAIKSRKGKFNQRRVTFYTKQLKLIINYWHSVIPLDALFFFFFFVVRKYLHVEQYNWHEKTFLLHSSRVHDDNWWKCFADMFTNLYNYRKKMWKQYACGRRPYNLSLLNALKWPSMDLRRPTRNGNEVNLLTRAQHFHWSQLR